MKPQIIFTSVFIFFLMACSAPQQESKNAVKNNEKSLVAFVDLTDPLDELLVKEGTELFMSKCTKCHTIDTVEFKVPALAGVTNRRSPEWIMNMIINVDEMLKQDPVAADLLHKHKKAMPDPGLNVEQTRAVLEFLRSNDMSQVGMKDQAASK